MLAHTSSKINWPLIGSCLVHMSVVALILHLPSPASITQGKAQTVELWSSLGSPTPTMEKIATSPVEAISERALSAQGEIALKKIDKKKPMVPPKTRASNTPEQIVERALAGLHQSKPSGHPPQGLQGSSSDWAAYKIKVTHRIKPYIQIPYNLTGNPIATVQVRLAPRTMEIIFVKLMKSSGHSGYDASVLSAVKKIGQFPPLPASASADSFRSILLNFSPR